MPSNAGGDAGPGATQRRVLERDDGCRGQGGVRGAVDHQHNGEERWHEGELELDGLTSVATFEDAVAVIVERPRPNGHDGRRVRHWLRFRTRRRFPSADHRRASRLPLGQSACARPVHNTTARRPGRGGREWLPLEDSNLGSRIQSPLSYR
jgi:hypothetical protein